MHSLIKPFIPTEGAPAATACSAYSICTSFPEGLKKEKRVMGVARTSHAHYTCGINLVYSILFIIEKRYSPECS